MCILNKLPDMFVERFEMVRGDKWLIFDPANGKLCGVLTAHWSVVVGVVGRGAKLSA